MKSSLAMYITFAPALILAAGVNEAVQRAFPEAQTLEKVALALSDVERSFIKEKTGSPWPSKELSLFVARSGGRLLGYAVEDNVKGKDLPITYLMAVSPDLRVKGVEILAYREAYGSEVRNSSWLRQFTGKSMLDALRPGKDIRSISGATISAQAVTFGVKRVLVVLDLLRVRLPR